MSLLRFAPDFEFDEKLKLRKSMVNDNIQRTRILAKIITVFEIISVIADITAFAFKAGSPVHLSGYLFVYSIMIIVNFLFLLYAKRFRNLRHIKLKRLHSIENVTLLYITFLMCWSSIISLMNQRLNIQAYLYMGVIMMCSVFYYADNKKVLVPFSISGIVLIIGLPSFENSRSALINNYLGLIVFSMMAWLCSRILYFNYCTDFKNRLLLEKSNSKLQEMSFIDELTSLPNRRDFNRYIDFISKCNTHRAFLVSMIMIDIDFFKQYNDSYGHTAGDTVLTSVAEQIKAVAECSDDFAARFGGEEFIYVSVDADEREIKRKAERIRHKVENLNIPHSSSPACRCISISLGTSTIRTYKGSNIRSCIELADKALYMAKTRGKNCVQSIDERMIM